RFDVQRQVAPHGTKTDDAEVCGAHDPNTPASACSNARSRDRIRSSSVRRAVRLSSPSDTTLDVALWPISVADSTHVRLFANRRGSPILPAVMETLEPGASPSCPWISIATPSPHSSSAFIHAANSAAEARSEPLMHNCVIADADAWTSGRSKNCAIM